MSVHTFRRVGPEQSWPDLELGDAEVSSALVLALLRRDTGILRIPLDDYRPAEFDVGRGWNWGLLIEQDHEAEQITFYLSVPDEQRPPQVYMSLSPDGQLTVGIPRHSLTGHPATDLHVAVVLALVRRHQSGVAVGAADYIRAGDDVLRGHHWSAHLEEDLRRDEAVVRLDDASLEKRPG